MNPLPRNPRVLLVTPEVTYLPDGMGNMANHLTAKAGGLADVLAAFVSVLFEPCGLSQMIGPIYGVLPVAHDTGGIHDTVEPMDIENDKGNGFLFETFDANGLFWAIKQAMQFYKQPVKIKEPQIKRIMRQSAEAFNHASTARRYMDLYEKMLQRPLINSGMSSIF